MLTFQKLDVYRCAIEFVAVTVGIQAAIPRGHGDLRDQLRRAAISVPLNIAEGSGRATEADASRTLRHRAGLGYGMRRCSRRDSSLGSPSRTTTQASDRTARKAGRHADQNVPVESYLAERADADADAVNDYDYERNRAPTPCESVSERHWA